MLDGTSEVQKHVSSPKPVQQDQLTSIPDLSLHGLSVDVNGPCGKLYADGRL